VSEAMAGRVSRIDLRTGEKTVVASGLRMPEGVAVSASGVVGAGWAVPAFFIIP